MRYVGTNNTISANNHRISYTDEGPDNAPVIIFIHGFPLNKTMWNIQIEALSDKFRVIVYDIRGFGNSTTGNYDFSIELFVQDLIAFMDVLKIEKAIVCGLSMGGYIALNAIVNFPRRFSALILCDTNCMADSPEAIKKRMRTIDSIVESGLEQYADESLKALFAPESFVTNREKIAVVKDMIMKTSTQAIFGTLIALSKRKETCTKLCNIYVPTLIIVGNKDKITPPDLAQLMQKNINGSQLRIVEHAGHLSNIENSYEFNDLIEKFVSRLKLK